jgi:nucleoid-associated protein YgaU
MTSRYINSPFFENTDPLYENVLEDRGLKTVKQYGTTTFKKLSPAQKSSLSVQKVSWQYGDRLDKLASRAYENPKYWWIIARFNGKPTDAHFQVGDLVRIPRPLNLILSFYTD